eukprot:TRINITY_DN148_c0_g1_i2.p1 TRINITY_DN148_c0_g1~~TRINITY_DN148_c0_g1_i2.p1  ORF type:complete len:301 (-),score=57.89 TRINITY_DN148_c0_g1_i2:52-954(-)
MTSTVPRFDASTFTEVTPAMSEAFSRDGVLVLEDIVSQEQCKKLRDRMAELTDELVDSKEKPTVFSTKDQSHAKDQYFFQSAEKISFFFEEDAFDSEGNLTVARDKAVNKVGHALHDLDPVFSTFSQQESFAKICKGVGLQNPLIVQSMYIFKQALHGGEVKFHQDATFLWTDPNTVVGLWIALEDATLENGCLWGLPGDQTLPVRERFIRHSDGSTEMKTLAEYEFSTEKKVPLEVKAGTMVVLHGAFPHMSLPNRSTGTRHAYSIHVVDESASYPTNNWLQRDVGRSDNIPGIPFVQG